MPTTMEFSTYTMESVNLICGDAGDGSNPGVSTHLVIRELKLPGLEENNVDHTAGGAWVQIEIPMFVNKLEAQFNLAGWQPDVMRLFGTNSRILQSYTAYGLIRDRAKGVALQARAHMSGRLGRVNPTNFRKNDLMDYEYRITSIVHYELAMAEAAGTELVPIYKWDFFTSDFYVGDRNINDEMINLLAIPGLPV